MMINEGLKTRFHNAIEEIKSIGLDANLSGEEIGIEVLMHLFSDPDEVTYLIETLHNKYGIKLPKPKEYQYMFTKQEYTALLLKIFVNEPKPKEE
jgi:hypothetical protein